MVSIRRGCVFVSFYQWPNNQVPNKRFNKQRSAARSLPHQPLPYPKAIQTLQHSRRFLPILHPLIHAFQLRQINEHSPNTKANGNNHNVQEPHHPRATQLHLQNKHSENPLPPPPLLQAHVALIKHIISLHQSDRRPVDEQPVSRSLGGQKPQRISKEAKQRAHRSPSDRQIQLQPVWLSQRRSAGRPTEQQASQAQAWT